VVRAIGAVVLVAGLLGGASATVAQQQPDADGDGVPDAIDRCPTRAGANPTGCPPRVLPAAFTAKAAHARDRHAPYRFAFSGRLAPPAGIPPAEACRGGLTVQVVRGAKAISSRDRSVKPDCIWRSTVTFARRSGRLIVMARFHGNDALAPRSAKRFRIRAG
jgi:hypothetical protein